MFITIEGIDYSGKTTQAQLLENFIKAQGKEVIFTHEPGGTVFAEKIRSLFINKQLSNSFPTLLCLLAARYDHYFKVIYPARKKGLTVISNRFFDSTVAYQGYGEGIDIQLIYKLHELILGPNFYPDLTIILEIDEMTFLKRSQVRRDAFENEIIKNSKYSHIIQGYQLIGKSAKRYHTINAASTIQEVHNSITKLITNTLLSLNN